MKNNIKVIIAVLCLVFILAIVYFLWPKGGVSFSSQQEELINKFGYPTSYVLAFGEMVADKEYRTVRFESWNYDRHGRTFYFVDGEFKKDSDIDFIDNAVPFPIKPNQFKQGLSFEQFKKIIKADPTVSGDVPESIMENTTIYDFSDQMKAGVKDGVVVYIQALPITLNK